MNPPQLFPGQTVFLDRNGTINRLAPQGEYIRHPSDLELLPGAADAIRSLNDLGITTIVVTNQRGVDLGLMSERDLESIHLRLSDLLAESNAYLDGIFYCPHGRAACECRKPKPGLLLKAKEDNPRVSLHRAVIIGDTEADVAAGQALGLTTIRLTSNAAISSRATLTAETLSEAIAILTGGRKQL